MSFLAFSATETGHRESAIFFWDWIVDKSKIENPEIALNDLSLAKELAKRGHGVFFEEKAEDASEIEN